MNEAVRPLRSGAGLEVLVALEPGQELRHSQPEPRVNEFRGDLSKRREHERPQVRAGVRHFQMLVRDHAIVIEQKVEIQRPGPVVNISAASVESFDLQQRVQQVVRWQPGSDGNNGIEIVGLTGGAADR